MNLKTFQYVIFMTSLVILSCGERKKVQDKQYTFKNEFTLKNAGTVRYELDSVTSPFIACMQYIAKSDSNQDMLAYLNEETGTLYFNSQQSNRIISTVRPQMPAAQLKKAFQGFYYHNPDSIFFYTFNSKVILANSNGEIKKTFDFKAGRTGGANIAYTGANVETKVLPTLVGDKLYTSSYVVGNLKKNEIRKNSIVLDVREWSSDLGYSIFPEKYYSDYGGLHYYLFYTTYNPLRKSIIYSYPAEKSLIVYSLDSNAVSTVVYDSTDKYQIPEYDESKYKDAPSGPVGEYFMRSVSFGPIIYDEFRNLYYRFIFLPVSEKNAVYEAKNAPTKQVSIAVLDENFRYLGEELLDKNKFWPNAFFVSRDGINIQNKTEGDSTLDFTLIQVTRNNQ